MAAQGSYADKLSEISSELAKANAYLQLAVRPDETFQAVAGGFLTSVDSCIARLVAAIPGITSWGLTDSNTSRLVAESMTRIVNELGGIFTDLFVPVDFDVDPDSLVGSIENYLKAVLSSITNPIAAVIATQQNILTEGLSQVKRILYNEGDGKGGSQGVYQQYADRLEKLVKSLFLNDPELGLSGLFMFAFEEGIPAIESEFIYLRRLKKLAKSGIEDAASLPDIVSPGLPNASAAVKLCEAEKWLKIVEDKLRRDNVFDRRAFGAASANVCATKDKIFDGAIDEDFINYLAGNLVGLAEAQVKSLASARFLPNVQFRLNIIQINFFIRAFEEADRDTRTLHNNLLRAIDLIDRLAETRIGDLLSLIVGLLRRQISGVRADLESQAQGFSGYNDAITESNRRRQFQAENASTTPRSQLGAAGTQDALANPVPYKSGLAGTTLSRDVRPGEKGAAFGDQQVDIYAYMSAQASAYVILSALCTIMQKTTAVYGVLDRVLAGESKVVNFVKGFTEKLKTECPSSQGGAQVVASTAAYVRALEDRLNGVTKSNDLVVNAAQTMLRRIEEYEKFLTCFKKQLFFGSETLAAIITTLANAVAAYRTARAIVQQIKMVIRLYPQIKSMFKNLDLARMLGLDGLEYNALDTIVGGLQCLVLQCDNPFVTDLASTAAQQFRNEFGKRRAEAITMGSLDEVPKTGLLSVILKKVQAIQRLVQLVNQLTNFNIKDLCNIKTPVSASPLRSVAILDAVKPVDSYVLDVRPWATRNTRTLTLGSNNAPVGP